MTTSTDATEDTRPVIQITETTTVHGDVYRKGTTANGNCAYDWTRSTDDRYCHQCCKYTFTGWTIWNPSDSFTSDLCPDCVVVTGTTTEEKSHADIDRAAANRRTLDAYTRDYAAALKDAYRAANYPYSDWRAIESRATLARTRAALNIARYAIAAREGIR